MNDFEKMLARQRRKSRISQNLGGVGVVIFSVLLLLSPFLLYVHGIASSSGSEAAARALKVLKIEQYEWTGYRMFACGEDDHYQHGFRTPEVEGVVCCGLWAKSCTVRFR